jgi:hypothetical protein
MDRVNLVAGPAPSLAALGAQAADELPSKLKGRSDHGPLANRFMNVIAIATCHATQAAHRRGAQETSPLPAVRRGGCLHVIPAIYFSLDANHLNRCSD